MNDEWQIRSDKDVLAKLIKEDLSDLSVDDLEARIETLRAEISRCEDAKCARSASKEAADSLFKT